MNELKDIGRGINLLIYMHLYDQQIIDLLSDMLIIDGSIVLKTIIRNDKRICR